LSWDKGGVSEMSLLVYDNSFDNVSKRLEIVITAAIPAGQIEMFRDMCSFIHRLRLPGRMHNVAVLFAATRKEFDDILSIRDLLRDLRIIIVLPDSDPNTICNAHSLRPRFLTFVSHDFEDLGAVLMKMLGISNSNRKEELSTCKTESEK
jgi:hypothetical protein